jgi:hypothetical protein
MVFTSQVNEILPYVQALFPSVTSTFVSFVTFCRLRNLG